MVAQGGGRRVGHSGRGAEPQGLDGLAHSLLGGSGASEWHSPGHRLPGNDRLLSGQSQSATLFRNVLGKVLIYVYAHSTHKTLGLRSKSLPIFYCTGNVSP
ncbi:hypothetical protein EMIT0P176_310008 [Pseudomonas sp. IT-P176]